MIGFDPGERIVCSGPDPTLPEAQWPSSRQFKKKNKHHRQRGHLHDYFARRDAEAMDQHHSTLTSCHTDLCHLQAADSQFSESFRNEAREKFNKTESAIRKVRANAYEGFDVDRAAVLRAIQKNREKEEHCQLELIRKKMNEKKQQLERHETEIRKELEGHQSRLDHLEDDVLQAGMKNVLELGNDIQAQYDQRIRTLHTVLGKLVEETESRMDHERAQRIRAFHAVEALRSEKKGSGISTII